MWKFVELRVDNEKVLICSRIDHSGVGLPYFSITFPPEMLKMHMHSYAYFIQLREGIPNLQIRALKPGSWPHYELMGVPERGNGRSKIGIVGKNHVKSLILTRRTRANGLKPRAVSLSL